MWVIWVVLYLNLYWTWWNHFPKHDWSYLILHFTHKACCGHYFPRIAHLVHGRTWIWKQLVWPWPVWLHWLEHCPIHQKVTGLIPSWGMYRRQPVDFSLSHWCFSLACFLSLPLSLKINGHILRLESKNKCGMYSSWYKKIHNEWGSHLISIISWVCHGPAWRKG